MSPDALPIHARALLEHQEFVRALAKNLLRDDHSAKDVEQETWLTVLTHPPRTIDSVRGWLAQVTRNHARDLARERNRCARREEAVARVEADDSEPQMHERLAVQHQVVEAVMGLREPYKTVIVLAYYEGLGAAEIAERRNVPAATVRAQLSRAHEMLRQQLDAKFGGERSVWSAVLATWSLGSSARISGAKLGLAAVVSSALLGTAVVVWSAFGRVTSSGEALDGLESQAAVANQSRSVGAEVDGLEQEGMPRLETDRVTLSASATTQRQAATPAKTVLDEMSKEGQEIQLLLRDRLLTPDPTLIATRPDLVRLPGTHFARLWERGALGADYNNLVARRGAGAFLSFATGLQDYDHEPDLLLEHSFRSGFYGNAVGLVVRFEGVRLGDLVDDRSTYPASVDREVWETLWEPSTLSETGVSRDFDARMRKFRARALVPVEIGGTYLVRSASTTEHDLVGAFEVIVKDEKSITIAWRVLERWDVPRGGRVNASGAAPDRLKDVGPAAAELQVLTTDELIQRMRAIGDRAMHLILDVPREQQVAWERYASQKDGGLARIAERSRWDALLALDGAGAYWSFTTRSNDYQKEAQIVLEQEQFSSGFAGIDRGYVLSLGEIPLEQVSVTGPPHGLGGKADEARAFLCDLTPVLVDENQSGLRISDADQARAAELGITRGTRAVVGRTYLVRSVQPDRQDVLAAFQVVENDDVALTIAWKVLRQRPASSK